MPQIVTTPQWFYGAATMLEIFAIVVAVLISLFSYKVYRITKDKKHLYFTTAFAFITLSFVGRALTIVYLATDVTAPIRNAVTPEVFNLGRFLYVMLVLWAYLGILLVYTKFEHKRFIAVMLSIILALIFLVKSSTTTFFVASALLLSFISAELYDKYRTRKKTTTLYIFIAFFLQVFQYIAFLSGPMYDGFFVLAYFLQFISYLILFLALIMVYKK
jgi:hypothetical protein